MTINHNGNGHSKITPIPCPMCGGELIYSDGIHDLICERNVIDRGPFVSAGQNGHNAPRMKDIDPPRGKSCIFALSFTESNHSGVLFNIRMDHVGMDYTALAGVMKKILRKGPGALARNYADAIINKEQRPMEKPTDEKWADRLGLAPEDLYSIKHSTETIKNLAQYYGLTEAQVRVIKTRVLCGNANSL